MNKNIFNFRRFGKYFASDIRTCLANYGLSLIAFSLLTPTLLHIFTVGSGLLFNHEWTGPAIWARAIAFVAAMICMLIIMPVKTYGKITEKQYGSQWLMIPASKLEKFMSMIILSCIIIPIAGAILYLGYDAIMCALDHTCGQSLIHGMIELKSTIVNSIQEIKNEVDMEAPEYETVANFIAQTGNPWLYIDDAFGMVLPFLLGALCFKSGKTVKTILALFAFSTVAGFVSAPLMTDWLNTMSDLQATSGDDISSTLFIFDSWMFRNIALLDTISDTIFNLALMAAIYFRVKTLKH